MLVTKVVVTPLTLSRNTVMYCRPMAKADSMIMKAIDDVLAAFPVRQTWTALIALDYVGLRMLDMVVPTMKTRGEFHAFPEHIRPHRDR
jgi:hypothetical protein